MVSKYFAYIGCIIQQLLHGFPNTPPLAGK